MLTAISPIDGRYADKTKDLSIYFSEFALIKYRVYVEILYFKALVAIQLPQLTTIKKSQLQSLEHLIENFDVSDAERIKEIERTTNHDVKAVEYFLKERFVDIGLARFKEFLHFGLTSQDVNNTAVPLSLKDALTAIYYPLINSLREKLTLLSNDWAKIPMLARTHGQPASPTLLGKEFLVFIERLDDQIRQLKSVPIKAKFGGATGNLNAHYAAYPNIDWGQFADSFIAKYLQLERSKHTTQIEHYDNLAAVFHALMRINTILIDFCRDVWTYISLDYFKQKISKGEVGSSAMPHKVNPIDFENAEGNLGVANALFAHMAEKLPVSRLQRDLTDSTVLRNIGVPFAHSIIAFQSILKGTDKLVLNEPRLFEDLENNWIVVAEAIQTILRRESYDQPYEALKELTRGNPLITKQVIHAFIDNLKVEDEVKQEMKQISPHNYTGKV